MNRPALGIIALALTCSILNSCGGGAAAPLPTPTPAPPPSVQIPLSPIKHLLIVVMQNSSFDHLFGTYPNANGLDPSTASYTQLDRAGNAVQPQLLSTLSPADLHHTRT